jgi:hypothetical protein
MIRVINDLMRMARVHLAEVDRLRRAGDDYAADALAAAVRAWLERIEREQGNRKAEGA